MEFELKDLLKDLNSPYWNIRLNAVSSLKAIDSAKDCLGIFRIIEKEDDNSLRFSFLQVLDDFLLRQNGDLEGAALYCLVNYSQKENKKVAARAEKVIDTFIHSPEVIRYRKLSAVRSAWGLLTQGKRKQLTAIILTNKLTELVPLLLLNFKSRDDELIRKTIDGLRNFGDARGNQYIKSSLENGSKKVRISSVKALGELGSILDYKSLKKCLHDNDPMMQIAAISAYGKLLGRFAHNGLIKLFKETDKILVKKEILTHFGKQKNLKSLKFLLTNYLEDQDPNVVLYSEWALYESRYSKKVEFLLGRYKRGELSEKYKVLEFLRSLFDTQLVPFYIEVIRQNEDPLLVMTVLDSLSHYGDAKSITALKEVLGNFKGDYSTYALLSLFKIKEVRAHVIIEDFICNDLEVKHSGHEVVLKALKSFHQDIEDRPRVESYLCRCITEAKLSQKVLALETSHFFRGQKVFLTIIGLLHTTESDVLKKAIYKSLVKIISLDPSLLEKSCEFLDHPQFAEVFNSSKASVELVTTIGLVLNRKALDFGVAFLYLHGKNLAQLFVENLPAQKGGEEIDFYLSYLDRNEVRLPRKTIVFLQKNFYNDTSRARKLSILSLSCLNPDQSNFSFFFDKVQELFNDDRMRHELTGHYIRGLCE